MCADVLHTSERQEITMTHRRTPGAPAGPGVTAPSPGVPGPRRARREPPGRPQPDAGGPRGAAVRAAELAACCVVSMVIIFVVLGVAAAVAFIVLKG
ncbi:hypothetical protein [Actinacidiphila guanduensis]|nr:hypothetical protein [Actinacidiphila guanduensis]